MLHTPVSNEFIQDYLRFLTGNAIKIFLYINMRGYGVAGKASTSSIQWLVDISGIDELHVEIALYELMAYDLIMKDGQNYTINYGG